MQDQIEVLKFEATPEAKHIGIAHIRLFRQVVLRYKVVENKDGSGYFIAPPSYKRELEGQEKWMQWFMLDSQVFSEEVQDTIRSYITRHFANAKGLQAPQAQNNSPSNQSYHNQQNQATEPVNTQKQYSSSPSALDDGLPF